MSLGASASRHKAVIALGSNIGDREFYLCAALHFVSEFVGEITKRSSVIETPAWGFVSSPFLNQIVVVSTKLTPLALLDNLQLIERLLGRTEKSTVGADGKPVYSARTIDLDILDYDGIRMKTQRLTLPHPHIHDRDFQLQLLDELNIRINN